MPPSRATTAKRAPGRNASGRTTSPRSRPSGEKAASTQEEREQVLGVSGLGFVGVAMAIAFAHYGHKVVAYDVVDARRAAIAEGRAPFFDPGLQEELTAAVESGRLKVAKDREELFRKVSVLFLCLPTPPRPDGSVDTSFLEEEAARLGKLLARAEGWRLIVVKSTSPPGTSQRIEKILAKESGKRPGKDFSVACNPEFLAEGSLVADALEPSRIVVGVGDARSERALRGSYQGFPGTFVALSPAAGELVKYASNALLAVKVSFANEMARLAEQVGVDIYPVMEAVGMDPRLGAHFLRAGPGFGGSCFPKDLRGLVAFAHHRGIPLPVTDGALGVNETQARHVVDLTESSLGSRVAGREVALLGLAFKSGTDDVRESRAYPILGELLKRGALVRLHDPKALEGFRRLLPPSVAGAEGTQLRFCSTAAEALRGASLALIQCDWPEYREVPLPLWKQLKDRLVVDARRSVDGPTLERSGVHYAAVGLGRS